MTTRTKRRLAVLALALVFIAIVPQVFHLLARYEFDARLGTPPHMIAAYTSANPNKYGEFHLWFGACNLSFTSLVQAKQSILVLRAPRFEQSFSLPREEVALRVGSAAFITALWLFAAGIRMLVRRCLRTPP